MNWLNLKEGLTRCMVVILFLTLSVMGTSAAYAFTTELNASGTVRCLGLGICDGDAASDPDVEAILVAEGEDIAVDTNFYFDGQDDDDGDFDFIDDVVDSDFVDTDIDIAPYYPFDEENYVTLSGVVRDPEGNPAQNVWVDVEGEFAYDCGLMPEPYPDGDVKPDESWTDCVEPFWGGGGQTDENGEFSISVAPGSRYNLFVNTKELTGVNALGGYFQDADGGSDSDPGPDGEWSGSVTNDWAEKSMIEVGEEGLSGVTITLASGSRIYGKALRPDGTPVTDLWVDASSDSGRGWGGSSVDEEGNFSVVVHPGEGYRVSSWPRDGLMGGYWKSGEDSALTASGQDGSLTLIWKEATQVDATSDVEINIILDTGNTISGRVTDEAGDPISGIWVNAQTGNLYPDGVIFDEDDYLDDEEPVEDIFFPEPLWYGAETDENGYYEISVYPAPDYRVSVSGNEIYRNVYYQDALNWEDATLLDASSADVTDINFTLKTGPGISGVISGLAAGDTAHIEVWSEEDPEWIGVRWDDFGRNWGKTSVTGTGSDVAFKVRNLIEGAKYRINVWAEGYLNGYMMENGDLGGYEEAAQIETGTENVKINLSTGKKISGTLSGLSEGDVVWIDAYSDSAWSKGGIRLTAEGDTAEFTLSGLQNARDFRVSVNADGYISGYYGGPGSDPVSWDEAVLVSTIDGDATGVNITMTKGHTISGTVTGLDERAYAYISAWSDTTGAYGGTEVVGTGEAVTYTIKCLSAASDFRVSVRADGYLGGYYGENGITDWEGSTLVDASANPSDINLTLSRGKTISGTITGLGKGEWAWIEARREFDGRYIEPLPVFEEQAAMMYYDCVEPGWNEGNWGGVNVRGTGEPVRYTITGLVSADDFIVTFRPTGYAPETRTGIDTSTEPADIDFVVSEGKSISGTIAGVKPGEWIWVNAWSESSWNGGGFAEIRADENGEAAYEIKGLGTAPDYVVSTSSGRLNLFYDQAMSWENATKVDLSEESATGIDFDFSAIEMFTISGTIAGMPEEGKNIVWIDAWSETGGWGNAEVNGNESFSIEVPAGDYKIGFYADGFVKTYYDAESASLTYDWGLAMPVSVTENVELGELTLSTGYSVSGVVTDAEGEAVSGIWVEIYDHTSRKGVGAGAVTNRRGEYQVSGLPDGTYTITLWSLWGYYEGEVTIDGADVTHDISLGGEEFGDITGQVNGGDVVLLFDVDGTFINAVETDESGEYAFSGLAAGEYTVKVNQVKADADDADGAFAAADGIAANYAVFDKVTVTPGNAVTPDEPDEPVEPDEPNEPNETKAVALSNGSDPDEWAKDAFVIEDAFIEGDILTLKVSYSGGCEAHEFELVAANYFMESYPVQAGIFLSHNGNDDFCEAYITEEVAFDLTPLKEEYQAQYPGEAEGLMVLQLQNLSNDEDISIDYKF